MRYRKNIDCLSSNELHELREALAAMYALPASDSNSFARIASFHGGPPTAYCRHGAPGFFTWHRAYLMAFENALRTLGCTVAVPFWDWSSGPSTGVPAACRQPTYMNRAGATVANPLYSGPRPAGGQTTRRADIDSTAFSDLATAAQAALASTTFTSFQNSINGVHGSVHVRTGGDMGFVPTASYDPIFYLHHANVDCLWAQWQITHPGALPASEGDFELPPFNRPFSIQWQRGSDVESVASLGYRYLRFCLFLPPIIIWRAASINLPVLTRRQMTSARLLIKATEMQVMPLEVRAFVNQPDANSRTKTIDNPAFAGAGGFIGHRETARSSDEEECAECAALGHTREHARHVAGSLKLEEQDHSTHERGEHDHGSHEHGGHAHHTAEERFDIEIDLTGVLRSVSEDDFSLKLVAVDADGDEVGEREVRFEDIEIEVE